MQVLKGLSFQICTMQLCVLPPQYIFSGRKSADSKRKFVFLQLAYKPEMKIYFYSCSPVMCHRGLIMQKPLRAGISQSSHDAHKESPLIQTHCTSFTQQRDKCLQSEILPNHFQRFMPLCSRIESGIFAEYYFIYL